MLKYLGSVLLKAVILFAVNQLGGSYLGGSDVGQGAGAVALLALTLILLVVHRRQAAPAAVALLGLVALVFFVLGAVVNLFGPAIAETYLFMGCAGFAALLAVGAIVIGTRQLMRDHRCRPWSAIVAVTGSGLLLFIAAIGLWTEALVVVAPLLVIIALLTLLAPRVVLRD